MQVRIITSDMIKSTIKLRMSIKSERIIFKNRVPVNNSRNKVVIIVDGLGRINFGTQPSPEAHSQNAIIMMNGTSRFRIFVSLLFCFLWDVFIIRYF